MKLHRNAALSWNGRRQLAASTYVHQRNCESSATAGEVNAKFMAVGISDVLNMWLGESERATLW